MGAWLKWYLEKFGSRDFIGLWLAWIGFVTLCVIEVRSAFLNPQYQVSTVFTTLLGGVIGYVVRSHGEPPAKEDKHKEPTAP